jgi:uncharacterized membrane protein
MGTTDKREQTMAFLSYLLSIAGTAVVLFNPKRTPYAAFHARQSLGIFLLAIISALAWVIAGWIVTWIPVAGPAFAAALFSLVVAACIILFVCWIKGMINAVKGKLDPVPIVGASIAKVLIKISGKV